MSGVWALLTFGPSIVRSCGRWPWFESAKVYVPGFSVVDGSPIENSFSMTSTVPAVATPTTVVVGDEDVVPTSAAAFSGGSAPKISTAASIPTKRTSATKVNHPSRPAGYCGR